MELRNTTAVITGAGSGIGRAAAHSFVRRGARVVVTDIDADRAAAVAGELGDAAAHARCDVTSVADLEAVRELALRTFGRVDLVMNNVGVLAVGPVEEIPFEAWQRIIDINLFSIVRSNLVFLPLLLQQGSGYVVNTASTAGLLPYGHDRMPYTATKHAVVGLSESLALYLRPKGVGVSCLCPAGVATNISEQITVYGRQGPTPAQGPQGPSFPVVDAATVGELVADGVTDERFLIVTADEVTDEVRRHGADIDAYLAAAGPRRPTAPRPSTARPTPRAATRPSGSGRPTSEPSAQSGPWTAPGAASTSLPTRPLRPSAGPRPAQ